VDPDKREPEVERDAATGRIVKGSLNPGGRPKKLREFQEKLEKEFYDEAFVAMRACLTDPDGRVRVAALKELWDRMFGKPAQAIVGSDGESLRLDIGLAEMLARLVK
jgi:hypothetical protein